MTTTASPIAARRRSSLYAALGVLMILFALIGFWPQYYGRLASGAALERQTSHLLVYLHSTLFMGWLAIFLVQAVLVQTGRTDVHRRLGSTLAGFGYIAAAVGVAAGIGLAAWRVTLGGKLDDAAAFVIAPLLDMAMFSIFLTLALRFRRRADVHKRMMVFAAYSFAFIGVVRFLVRTPGAMDNGFVANGLLCLPVLLFIALDYAVVRRVHPAWLWGLGIFATRLAIEAIGPTAVWLPVGRALVRPFV